MAEKLTWDDAEKIGALLSRKHPELYPLSTDLEEMFRQLRVLGEVGPLFEDCRHQITISIRGSWYSLANGRARSSYCIWRGWSPIM